MSTTTTTTTRDRGDRYGPMEWAQLRAIGTHHKELNVRKVTEKIQRKWLKTLKKMSGLYNACRRYGVLNLIRLVQLASG